MKWIAILLVGVGLAACSSQQDDIQNWMNEQAKGMKGAVKPLPQVTPFPVVEYDASGLDDPFKPTKLEPEKGGDFRPDANRRREPLEAYPLESLQMVGFMVKGKVAHAIIRADKNLHQVHVGNYLGQNYGVITRVTESEVTLKELVEDVNGEWTERISSLQLQEQETKK